MTERLEDEKEAERLLKIAQELSAGFPEGLVFIGGLAVSEHARDAAGPVQPEFTHDGDFYLALQDLADLRDIEDVGTNRRLSKHELRKGGFDFDIYVEGHNNLSVPYADVAAYSIVSRNGLRVAALEHLLVLKGVAALDRQGSAKGAKDNRDLAKILVLMDNPRAELVEKHITPEVVGAISKVGHSTMLEIAKNNAHAARELAARASRNWKQICAGLSPDLVPPPGSRTVRGHLR